MLKQFSIIQESEKKIKLFDYKGNLNVSLRDAK